MPFPVAAAVSLIGQVIGLGSELIEDKDKRNEFVFKSQEMSFQLLGQLLTTKTVPWVDAVVKILMVGKAFVRPLGGALMTAFGAYAHFKGIEIPPAMHAIFDGALPAWGVSRHAEKREKIKVIEQAPKRAPEPDTEWFWE
jgi:hypothetical protein